MVMARLPASKSQKIRTGNYYLIWSGLSTLCEHFQRLRHVKLDPSQPWWPVSKMAAMQHYAKINAVLLMSLIAHLGVVFLLNSVQKY